MARPLSAKSVAVLWCLDSQVFIEVAIRAEKEGRRSEAIRAMQAARACSQLAVQKVEGLENKTPKSL